MATRDIRERARTLLDGSFPQLNHTTIGDPVAVYNPHKAHQYWLVPFLLGTKVRGIAMLELSGGIVSHGVLAPNVQDEAKLMDKAYFEAVPEMALGEIERQYGDYALATPFFSYDATPRKWAWLVALSRDGGTETVNVFIGPDGWYQQRLSTGREG